MSLTVGGDRLKSPPSLERVLRDAGVAERRSSKVERNLAGNCPTKS